MIITLNTILALSHIQINIFWRFASFCYLVINVLTDTNKVN